MINKNSTIVKVSEIYQQTFISVDQEEKLLVTLLDPCLSRRNSAYLLSERCLHTMDHLIIHVWDMSHVSVEMLHK